MKLQLILAGTALSALMLAGCGKSDTQKQLEQTVDSLKNAANATAQTNNGQGSTGTSSGGQHKPVPAVDFHKLQAMLPNIAGYTKGEAQGSSMSMGEWNYSNATAEYTNGDSRINVSIFDYAYIESLLAAYKMKFNFENEDGYTKTMEIGGCPGWETWTKKEKEASCTAMAGDRFVIVVEGHGQNDASVVHAALASIDLKSFSGLQ